MTQHTPTPWMLEARPSEMGVIKSMWGIAAHGKTVCKRVGTTNEDRSNAAFIVRACNAHEELMASLRLASHSLDLQIRRYPNDSLTEIAVAAQSRVLAAIDKAEGK